MSTVLEITQLTNGDVVLRDAGDAGEEEEPLVRISFSGEVRDMLGDELVGVAEAMIDAATDFMGSEPPEVAEEAESPPPVIH
jgi:hypothetical protein